MRKKWIFTGAAFALAMTLTGCRDNAAASIPQQSSQEQTQMIPMEEAQEAALKAADIVAADADISATTLSEVAGVACYKVEFTSGEYAYAYTINAETGAVMEMSSQEQNAQASGTQTETADPAAPAPAQNATGTGTVDEAAAQKIALEHAGVKAADATITKSKLDYLQKEDINEQEAEIVRLIFDKYVYEGYGAQRIATYLNNAGYRARSGKCWHPGSLRGMVGNLTYMGVLRCGDARSELMPELQIIPQEEFEAAQRIREDRSAHAAEEAEHHVPLRTRGQALLSNNVYCGHCGARLALTTSRKWRKLPDGTLDDTLRIRYTCYGKLRKQTECTGQTGYTMHILDEIIDKMVREIFSRLRGIPKEQLIISRYAKETAERKNHLQALQAERDKAEKDLLALKAEILAVIKGESAFPKDTLAEMIAAQEKKHTELETLCEEASAELERNAELMANVSQLYEELISYADLYDSASFEAKKMIVSQLIRRIDVYRGYQIHVDFNFDLAQYLENSDELAC